MAQSLAEARKTAFEEGYKAGRYAAQMHGAIHARLCFGRDGSLSIEFTGESVNDLTILPGMVFDAVLTMRPSQG